MLFSNSSKNAFRKFYEGASRNSSRYFLEHVQELIRVCNFADNYFRKIFLENIKSPENPPNYFGYTYKNSGNYSGYFLSSENSSRKFSGDSSRNSADSSFRNTYETFSGNSFWVAFRNSFKDSSKNIFGFYLFKGIFIWILSNSAQISHQISFHS